LQKDEAKMKVTFRKTQIDGDGDPLVKSIVHFLATVASLLLLTGNVNAKAAAYSSDDVAQQQRQCSSDAQRESFVSDSIVVDLVALAARDAADANEVAVADCYWTFTTADDRILVLSATNLQQIEAFVDIHNGLSVEEGNKLLLKDQVVLEKSRKDLPPSVYSTGKSVLLRIDHAKLLAASKMSDAPLNSFQLRIAKAVNCPFNLGAESQCGRILDSESCYCATFTLRTWQGQYDYCRANNGGMSLVALETNAEEKAIHDSWTTTTKFWCSLNDFRNTGIYIWAATASNLYPWGGGVGYANWAPGQPDHATADSNCITMNNVQAGWDDFSCLDTYNGVCELQP